MGAKSLNHVQQELFDAVRKGDLEKVNLWLNNRKNKRPRTPLNFLRPATPQPSWLHSIVDPSNGYTVLHLAALQGHSEIVKVFLNADSLMANVRDRRGCLPIHLAAWNGHYDSVKILIDFEPTSVDSVNNAKESPLHLSSQHGHSEVVSALLSKHADARLRNARSETALDIAARLGRADVCRLIICSCPELALQTAADCSATDCSKSRFVSHVVYPLHAAARHGFIDCMTILCQSGFDINFVTEEGSALHVAALFGKVEAVKFLLQQGINTEIRDSRGRTVIETLYEHESEKASDLTQIIQSRDGWSECRKAVETYSQGKFKKELEKSPTLKRNLKGETYQNVVSKNGLNNDVIWRSIPDGSTVRAQERQTDCTDERISVNGIYHPSSIQANLVLCDENEFDEVSSLSLSTTLPDISEKNSSSQPSPSLTSGVCSPSFVDKFALNSTQSSTSASMNVPSFPLTSISNKNRHISSYRCRKIPPKMGVNTTLQNPGEAACCYQAPYNYDAWNPSRTEPYDNVPNRICPMFAYDNVPRNLLVYDNAPPSGHRRWEHKCCGPTRTADSKLCSTAPNTSSDGPKMAYSGCCVPEEEEIISEETQNRGGKIDIYNIDRSESSLHSGQRSVSMASTVAFTSPIPERSISPDSFSKATSAAAALAHGRAPLALPEEICGSTSTSILSISNSPELHARETSIHRNGLNTHVTTDESSLSDRASSSTVRPFIMQTEMMNKLPSPETTKSRIHEFLCSQVEDAVKDRSSVSPKVNTNEFAQDDLLSPSVTDSSGFTLASSCSLPVISCLSSGSSSAISPLKESPTTVVTEEPSVSLLDVRLRSNQINFPTTRPAIIDGRIFAASCLSENSKNEISDCDSNTELKGTTSSDKTNEWKKINEMMESFGDAIYGRSSTLDRYKAKVGVYIRDRQSHALTLQLSEAHSPREPLTIHDTEVDELPVLDGVSEWLNTCVGIPNSRAKEVATILESHGFDSTNFMHFTLDKECMNEIGLDKSIQHQIGIFFQNSVKVTSPNANNFDYVSDWLHSLYLEDYLGHFMNAGLTSMSIVTAVDPSDEHLKALGIPLLGHRKRLVWSLRAAKKERRQLECALIKYQDEETDSGQESRSTAHSSSSAKKPRSLILEHREAKWRHTSSILINGCVSYSAHYLGSMEISNIEGTEDSRRAMVKLKKGIRENSSVLQVLLKISVAGVQIIDCKTNEAIVEHDIARIQIVCQDEHDLNCFAYISQDGERHFCHVFCVLTADIATEIIITLGQAFEVCFRIANGNLD